MLHEFLFLLSLDGFTQAVFQRHRTFVGIDKLRDEFPSAPESRLHLRPDGLPVLLQHLERLVKPRRRHGQRIIPGRPVEAFLEAAADFHAVVQNHVRVLGLDDYLHVVVPRNIYFDNKAFPCNNGRAYCIYNLRNFHFNLVKP